MQLISWCIDYHDYQRVLRIVKFVIKVIPQINIPKINILNAIKLYLPIQLPVSAKCCTQPSIQMLQLSQWRVEVSRNISIALLVKQKSQRSPSLSVFGLLIPGFMSAVKSHTMSKYIITTNQRVKKGFPLSVFDNCNNSIAPMALTTRKAMRKNKSYQFKSYNQAREQVMLLLYDNQSKVLYILRLFVDYHQFRYNFFYNFHEAYFVFQLIFLNSFIIMNLIIKNYLQFFLYVFFIFIAFIFVQSVIHFIFHNIFIQEMMNLQITGKKMSTPVPTKKIEQIIKSVQPAKTIKQPEKPKIVSNTKPLKKIGDDKTNKKIQNPIIEQKIVKQTEVKKKQQIQIKVQQAKPQIVVEPSPPEALSEVVVRYNHYKEKFISKNDILSFVPIQEKYGFSDVFKGNFLPVLKIFRTIIVIEPITTGRALDYSWRVDEGKQYQLEITEDDEEQSKYEKKAYKAPIQNKSCPFKKNAQFQQLTKQMKNLTVEQLGSAKHRELLQQRDLQDILYS